MSTIMVHVGNMLNAGIHLATAQGPSQIVSGFAAIEANVFAGGPLPEKYRNDVNDASCAVRSCGSRYDKETLDSLKTRVLADLRPRIDQAASAFALQPKDAEALRTNGFESLGHFSDLVVQGRKMDLLSLQSAAAMIQSAKLMYAQNDFDELMGVVTVPTSAEKRSAIITALGSVQMGAFYGLVAIHAILWGATAFNAALYGMAEGGTLVLGATALLSLPTTFRRSVITAVGDLKTALQLAGRPEELKRFFMPHELRD